MRLRHIARALAVRLRRQRHLGNRSDRLVQPPGMVLLRTAKFMLTRDVLKRYVEPSIADMQHEYFDAVIAGQEWLARWVVLRGYCLVIPGWIYGSLRHAQRRLFKSYKL
jgi:hypothetical protein